MGARSTFRSGEARSYNLTLDGPLPSFTFSWADALGRSGAVSLKSHQSPTPCPQPTAGCAAWRSPPWSGRRGKSAASSPRSASRRPGRRWTFRSTAATSAGSPHPAGRNGHPHHRNGQRRRRKPPGQRVLRRRRSDPFYPARRQPEGGPQAGNHGGPHGDAERADAAHAPDHPPPGPDRRVHPAGDLPLRRELDDQDGANLRPPPRACAGRGEPTRSRNPHPHRGHSPGRRRGSRRPLRVPPRSPAQATAAKGGADPVGDSSWWSWPW